MSEPQSILSRAYRDGYKEGVGQASQLFHEDDYWSGVAYARSQIRSRHHHWFMLGFLLGAALATLAWWLV